MFEEDPQTEAVLMIGEIGGTAEEEAAALREGAHEEAGRGVHRRPDGPAGKRMGHAGAIISGGKGTAAEKIAALREAEHRHRGDPGRARQDRRRLHLVVPPP